MILHNLSLIKKEAKASLRQILTNCQESNMCKRTRNILKMKTQATQTVITAVQILELI